MTAPSGSVGKPKGRNPALQDMGAAAEETEPLAWWTYVGVGVLWYLSSLVLDAGGVSGRTPDLLLAAAFIGTFGIACLVNGRRCGALHCRLSGKGYLLVSGLALAGAFGAIDVSMTWIYGLFGGVFVVSYAAEVLVERMGTAEPAE